MVVVAQYFSSYGYKKTGSKAHSIIGTGPHFSTKKRFEVHCVTVAHKKTPVKGSPIIIIRKKVQMAYFVFFNSIT